ncbi:MAG: hypothetical protein JWR05_174 [Mucilaginibacter sp.]|nr:hypothetical protein [Mucilaginibacter sp.]
METINSSWVEGNQRYLMAAVSHTKLTLEIYQTRLSNAALAFEENEAGLNVIQAQMDEVSAALPAPATLETLGNIFGLSSFEKALLVMCAGVELDSSFATLIASLRGNSHEFLPSFSLAFAALPNAHWSAISPNGPLRYWRLIELNPDQLVSKASIKIDEYILHYLTGVNHLDERLSGIAEPFSFNMELVPSHLQLVDEIVKTSREKLLEGAFEVFALGGSNRADKPFIAANLARKIDLHPYIIPLQAIPATPKEVMELARIWNREAALKSYALLLDYAELDTTEKLRMQLINRFIDQVQSLIVINCDQPPVGLARRPYTFTVDKPTVGEQLALWKKHLGNTQLIPDLELKRLVAQFDFSTKGIYATVAGLANQSNPKSNGNYPVQLLSNLWQSCCTQARPDTGELLHRINCIASMDDLVLPQAQKEMLRDLTNQVKHRSKVYNEWGFASRNNRGLGITALFAGESGTGKTMAAEVVAKALNLDLYRIDLSQVINKYIGETEKNLKKIFDAAEDGGAILLFDEADALFGKRSEVKDSHDRYANVEVSYLLQRMEAYRGLAILTTNMKNVMDKAWMRRIRFVIQFPFPGPEQRAEIWKRIFPAETPTNLLDIAKLAKLNLAGGNIKNISMNAAFIAASENEVVGMQHLQRALRTEYDKMEKPLTNGEIGLLK